MGTRFTYISPITACPTAKTTWTTQTTTSSSMRSLQVTGPFQDLAWKCTSSASTKKAGLADLDLGVGQKYYTPAYLELVDKTGGTKGSVDAWDTKIRAKLATLSAHKQCAIEPGDQGAATEAALQCRSWADFKTALQATKPTWTPGEFNALLVSETVDTLAGYKDYCEDIADKTVPAACSPYLKDNGINIIHFEKYWVTTDGVKSSTLGFASLGFEGLTHSKCGYLEVGDYSSYVINGIDKTTGHEIGHTLYLPHAYSAGGYVNAVRTMRIPTGIIA